MVIVLQNRLCKMRNCKKALENLENVDSAHARISCHYELWKVCITAMLMKIQPEDFDDESRAGETTVRWRSRK